ncbi:unnamed protein product, partial [Nesidiocoris tenuis]
MKLIIKLKVKLQLKIRLKLIINLKQKLKLKLNLNSSMGLKLFSVNPPMKVLPTLGRPCTLVQLASTNSNKLNSLLSSPTMSSTSLTRTQTGLL